MTGVAPWLLTVLAGAGGVALMLTAALRLGRRSLRHRLHHYLGAVAPARGAGRACSMLGRVGRQLTAMLGDRAETERRLARAGREGDLARYQVERARWAVTWAAAAVLLGSAALLTDFSTSPLLVLLAAVAVAPGGVVVCDRRLKAIGERRIAALRQELPAAADLYAMSVGAGESLRSGIERVAAASHGPCGEELRCVVTDVAAGTALRDALGALARRLDLAELRRLADTVGSTATLGAPAAGPLGALASDLREQTRRELVEDAGRRQVGMLVPVVGLILPAALLFAFYPAVVALRDLAG